MVLGLFPNPRSLVPWVPLHRVDALLLAAVQPVLCLPPLSPSLSPLCLLWLAPLSCPCCWWSGTLLWQGAPSSDTSGSLRSDCPAARAGQSLLHFSLALWMSLRYSSRGRGNVHAQRVTAPKSCSSINQRGVWAGPMEPLWLPWLFENYPIALHSPDGGFLLLVLSQQPDYQLFKEWEVVK